MHASRADIHGIHHTEFSHREVASSRRGRPCVSAVARAGSWRWRGASSGSEGLAGRRERLITSSSSTYRTTLGSNNGFAHESRGRHLQLGLAAARTITSLESCWRRQLLHFPIIPSSGPCGDAGLPTFNNILTFYFIRAAGTGGRNCQPDF